MTDEQIKFLEQALESEVERLKEELNETIEKLEELKYHKKGHHKSRSLLSCLACE